MEILYITTDNMYANRLYLNQNSLPLLLKSNYLRKNKYYQNRKT